ncbi:hypothetical protein C2845_PM16G08570 [Panicum miliaceum]|uniref:cellulase n=1 Tax=Panicum miliaceum TaxID=4540 RepID=A0A3L6PVE3_PANMI|nr:hypothetical protein C2845_PM16G08570 [Panicum miliaceum]
MAMSSASSNRAALAAARPRAMPPPSSPRGLVLIAGLVVSLLSGSSHVAAGGHPDYADALGKAILFFQGQRSGKLPPDQAVTWRSNSGLSDGSSANVRRPKQLPQCCTAHSSDTPCCRRRVCFDHGRHVDLRL